MKQVIVNVSGLTEEGKQAAILHAKAMLGNSEN